MELQENAAPIASRLDEPSASPAPSSFRYRDSTLFCEDVDLSWLASQVGTPAFVYSSHDLVQRYRACAAAFRPLNASVHYAVKACHNLSVVALLARAGAGADVVSGGELRRALKAGVRPEKIVFSGVGKTEAEIAEALATGIYQIAAESREELALINAVALARGGDPAPVALRVNPDISAGTDGRITTGVKGNKFGVDYDLAREVMADTRAMPGLNLVGLTLHIGSQITTLAPYRAAYARIADLYREQRAAGFALSRLDLGGGLGVPYEGQHVPTFAQWAESADAVRGLGAEISIEPGRALVAQAGLLLTRVIYVKSGADRRFAIVDAAMNDFVRPAMYGAFHRILPVALHGDRPVEAYDVVGPICESTDTFATGRAMPEMRSDDLLVLADAGAYGAAMSSAYNSRPPAAEVMISGSEWHVIRRRPTIDDLLADEVLVDVDVADR